MKIARTVFFKVPKCRLPDGGRHFGLILRQYWLQSGYDPAWMSLTYARATVGSPVKAKVARHVSAIDIDPALLDTARYRVAETGVSNCEFIAGDAYDIAKLVGPADFVFMANAFYGVPDRAQLAQAVANALKPNGEFAIVNWHKRPREETPILGEPLVRRQISECHQTKQSNLWR